MGPIPSFKLQIGVPYSVLIKNKNQRSKSRFDTRAQAYEYTQEVCTYCPDSVSSVWDWIASLYE